MRGTCIIDHESRHISYHNMNMGTEYAIIAFAKYMSRDSTHCNLVSCCLQYSSFRLS